MQTSMKLDSLEESDRKLAQSLEPAEKLAQALEMMSMGIELKRSSLQRRFPNLSAPEIEQLLVAWLTEDV